jgi:anti-sigma factor RsiW
MMKPSAMPPITTDTLHAYADDRLDAAGRAAVEAWLAEHPEAAEEIQAWRHNDALLRAAYDPVLAEPIPERLRLAARPTRRPLLRIAAALAWLALGTSLGYGLRGMEGPTSSPTTLAASLPRDAAIAHAVYVPEVRHPVEVGADQEAHLVAWLSKRLGTPLRVPTLGAEGYALVGGRLLPGEGGPVAQFMYQQGDGRRLTLYVRGGDGTDKHANRETAFRYAREDGLSVFYWVDGPLGYALSGDLPREELLPIATAVYRQLNP